MNSAELIINKIDSGSLLNDKIYVTCKKEIKGDVFKIIIDESCPVVVLNEKTKELLVSKNLINKEAILVKDIASGKFPDLVLLSGGAFILDSNNKLILLQRDTKAPSYPGFLTEPAGRCGELPSKTIIKELNEELLFYKESSNQIIGLIEDENDYHLVLDIKKEQSKMLPNFAKDIEMEKLDLNEKLNPDLAIIEVHLSNKIIKEEIKGLHWFDEKDNTIELRQVFKLSFGKEIFVKDGEPFNRVVDCFLPDDLLNKKMTNCLSFLVASARIK